MSAISTVTDPLLLSVLAAADRTRAQCLTLLSLLEENASTASPSEPTPESALVAISKQQKTVLTHLMQVRALTRKSIEGVRQTKQATTDARAEVDTLRLRLQNLEYEQRHLRGEIQGCEGYEYVSF